MTENEPGLVPPSKPESEIARLQQELADRKGRIAILEERLAGLESQADRVETLRSHLTESEIMNKEASLQIANYENEIKRLGQVNERHLALKAAHEETVRILDFERMRKAPMGIIGRIIVWGNMVSGAVGLLIILSVIGITLLGPLYATSPEGIQIPAVLENWGGIVLGFYFGTFMGLVKDFMNQASGLKEGSSRPGD
jgi:hypothetical protein